MKPHPRSLLACLENIGIDSHLCVMVGDSITDGLAAAAAGVPFVGIANKPAKREQFAALGCKAIASAMSELTPQRPVPRPPEHRV
jgi:phosphoglycolate phosphatase-like HAD superfamily hydrolase